MPIITFINCLRSSSFFPLNLELYLKVFYTPLMLVLLVISDYERMDILNSGTCDVYELSYASFNGAEVYRVSAK